MLYFATTYFPSFLGSKSWAVIISLTPTKHGQYHSSGPRGRGSWLYLANMNHTILAVTSFFRSASSLKFKSDVIYSADQWLPQDRCFDPAFVKTWRYLDQLCHRATLKNTEEKDRETRGAESGVHVCSQSIICRTFSSFHLIALDTLDDLKFSKTCHTVHKGDAVPS